jgi:hypothetical protein
MAAGWQLQTDPENTRRGGARSMTRRQASHTASGASVAGPLARPPVLGRWVQDRATLREEPSQGLRKTLPYRCIERRRVSDRVGGVPPAAK